MGVNLSCYSVLGSEPFTAGELVGRNAFLVFTRSLTRARPGILAMGIHGGTPYWDCSEGFAREMEKLVAEHTDGKVVFMAPFLTWTKSEVYEYFLTTGIDVSVTYSCEAGTSRSAADVPPVAIGRRSNVSQAPLPHPEWSTD